MIWFIDEYFDKQLRALELCPGLDITIETRDAEGFQVCVSIFWHIPSTNLDWFPICQIDLNDCTIFHREGGEDPETWPDFMDKAADALSSAMTKGE